MWRQCQTIYFAMIRLSFNGHILYSIICTFFSVCAIFNVSLCAAVFIYVFCESLVCTCLGSI